MRELWAIKEAKNMNLKDERRNLRAAKILEAMVERPSASIPQANNSWGETKGTYRFVETDSFNEQDILEGHYKATYNRINSAGNDVIILSDGMEVALCSLKKTSGLGPIGEKYTLGFLTHNTLALTEDLVPLGLINIKYWVRKPEEHGKRKLRQQKKIQDKESYAWIESLESTEKNLLANVGYTFIGDGGADIYDVLAFQRRPNSKLLIHLIQNRNIKPSEENSEKIFDALKLANPLGFVTIDLPRTPTKQARQATLEIKVTEVDIKPPDKRKKEKLPTKRLTAISACEVKKSKSKYTRKSKNQKREKSSHIVWKLLTTASVISLEDATALVFLYAKRWLIERYHYILKEGCRIEKLQMESVDNFKRAVALYSIVAWRLMYITYIARIDPDAKCTITLSNDEWQALWCYVNKKKSFPSASPTIKEAVLLLAKLGGFLARKGDGQPGAKVIWRGLMALDHITAMFVLFKG